MGRRWDSEWRGGGIVSGEEEREKEESSKFSFQQNITFEGFEDIVALVIDDEDKGQISVPHVYT